MKTKEELLKIYSAYLPYELGIEFHRNIYPRRVENQNLDFKNLELWFSPAKKNSFIIKPILYSMDMLTKEIEHKGERFVPLHKILEEYCFDLSKMDDREILSYAESLIEIDMTVTTYNLLLEWHFNVFNLEESEYIKKQPVIQK